jgi:hypothetical protein
MRLKPEQHEKFAEAYFKDAHNKQLAPERRMEARGEAKRWRALAKWARKLESQKQGN